MAHIADWDDVFLTRMRGTQHEIEPSFANIDEGQVAIDNGYAHKNPFEQLELFKERRAQMLAFLESLSGEEWQRVCLHPLLGRLSLEGAAILVSVHDSYHLRQVREWRGMYNQTPQK